MQQQGMNPSNAMQWIQQLQLQQQLAAQQQGNHPEGMNWFQQQLAMQQQQQQLNLYMQLQQQQQQQQQQPGQAGDFQREMHQRIMLEHQRQMAQQQQQQQAAQKGKPSQQSGPGRRGKAEPASKKGANRKAAEKAHNAAQLKLLKQQQQQQQQQNLAKMQSQAQHIRQLAEAQRAAQLQAQAAQAAQSAAKAASQAQHSQPKGKGGYNYSRDTKPGPKGSKHALPTYANGLPVAKGGAKIELPKAEPDRKRKNGDRKDFRLKSESKKVEGTFKDATAKAHKKLAAAVKPEKKEVKIPDVSEHKKRRVNIESISKPKPESVPAVKVEDYQKTKPSLTLASGSPSDLVTLFIFEKTPECRTVTVDNEEALIALFKENAEKAAATTDKWARLPQAGWLKGMINELKGEKLDELYKKHRSLQTHYYTAGEVDQRWESLTAFTESILAHWFEDKSLDDVIALSTKLGQTEMEGGVLLRGKLVNDVLSRGGVQVGTVGLLSQLKTLMSKSNNGISVYSLDRSSALHTGNTHYFDKYEDLEGEIRKALAEQRAIGSLNTTFDYDVNDDKDQGSGVAALDSYHRALDNLAYSLADSAVEMNPRMYLIWKLQDYMTAYHQDNHVVPHMTLYQQSSGYSVFHFLPPVIGLYVTHLGKTKTASEIHAVLKRLDEAGIGSYGVIGPGDAALIFPFSSHGVYVPNPKYNASLGKFEVSQVRAAEFILSRIKESVCKDVLGKDDWNTGKDV